MDTFVNDMFPVGKSDQSIPCENGISSEYNRESEKTRRIVEKVRNT